MADQNFFDQNYVAPSIAQTKQPPASDAGASGKAGQATNFFDQGYNVPEPKVVSKEDQQKMQQKIQDDAKYEQRIQAWMPEAKAQAEKQGYIGAIGQGFRNVPIIGDIVGAAGSALGAATGAGYEHLSPEENTFSNRYKNIQAGEEALNRAYDKSHPITKTGIEIAGSFALPAGGIAKGIGAIAAPAANAVGKLASIRSVLAPIIGIGAEGAAYGAGSAATEQALGTKPENQKPSIGDSALIGGALGTGIGAALKGGQKALEAFGPEWIKTFGSADESIARAIRADSKNGTVNMTPSQAIDLINQGQNIKIADLYGPNFQDALRKATSGRPELLQNIKNQLEERSQLGGERFINFVDEIRGTSQNAAELQQQARDLAFKLKNEGYSQALQPGRNSGAWLPEWDNFLKSPTMQKAIAQTESEIKENMIRSGVDPVNFLSPFKYKTAMNPKTGEMEYVMNAATGTPQIESVFKNRVDTLYLDQLQKELNNIATKRFGQEGATKGISAAAAADYRKQILDTLRKPEINGKPNRFYDPEYINAQSAYKDFRETGDAWTYGISIPSLLTNQAKASEVALAGRNMKPEERNLAANALMTQLIGKVTKADNSINTTLLDRYLRPGYVRDAISNILTPDQMNHFERYAKTENLMRDTYNAVMTMGGGSKNDKFVTAIIYALLDYRLFGARIIGQAISDKAGDAFAKKMIDKFSSGNINDFNEVYNVLRNNPRYMNSLADKVNNLATQATKIGSLGAVPITQQGYQQKAMGGSVNKRAQRNKQIESAAASLIQAGTHPDQPMKDGGTPNPNYIPHDDPRRAQNLEKFKPMKDKAGKPHRVFHNTNREFSEFDTLRSELGSHFGTPNQAANLQANQLKPLGNRRTMAAYLSLQNPLRLKDEGDFSPERVANQLFDMGLISEKKYDKHMMGDFHSDEAAIKDLQNAIKKAGHDGVVYLNRREGLSQHPDPKINDQNMMWHFAMSHRASDEDFKQKFPEAEDSYIAFHPTQIKSATGNQGTFDPADPYITKKRGGDVEYIPHEDKRRAKNLKEFHGKTPKEVKESRWFHGTGKDFSTFNDEKPIFVTKNPRFANRFAMEGLPSSEYWGKTENRPSIMPVHVRAERPFDYENKRHVNNLINASSLGAKMINDPFLRYQMNELKEGHWDAIENPHVQQAIKELGHDSFYVKEDGIKNLAVYHPSQLKSSVGNQGTFDPSKTNINEKRGGVVRPKRATGGRIPEIDKMFKQAKKYVDAHTKGILDAPDDVVVKALNVAKRKI